MDVIQTLWTHGFLSTMERLCLCSYMKNGHEVHLYRYDNVQGIPEGVVVKDCEEIIPRSLFDYKKFINNGTFADYFRYKLLLDRGGWWVDTDLVALKPFDFSEEFVFGYMGPWFDDVSTTTPKSVPPRALRRHTQELSTGLINPERIVSNNCIKVPAGSRIMKYMWEECCKFDPAKVNWSEDVGPKLLDKAVKEFGLSSFVKGTHAFNPVYYFHTPRFINPEVRWNFPEDVYAVHLWNDLWTGRTNWEDKHTWQITGCPPILQNKEIVIEGSLYGDLVKRYL